MSTDWRAHQHLQGSEDVIAAIDDLCVYAKLRRRGAALERHRERAATAAVTVSAFLERLASWSREREGAGMVLGIGERERRLVDFVTEQLRGGEASVEASLDQLAALTGSFAHRGPSDGIVPRLERIRAILQAEISPDAARILGEL